MEINYLDLTVLLILIIMGVRGGLRGFVEEVAGLLGLLAGILLVQHYFHEVSEFLTRFIAETAAPAVAFVLLLLAGIVIVGILARLLQKALHISFVTWLDRLLGIGAGLCKGLLLCIFFVYVAHLLVPHFPFMQNSIALEPLLDLARRVITWLHISAPLPGGRMP